MGGEEKWWDLSSLAQNNMSNLMSISRGGICTIYYPVCCVRYMGHIKYIFLWDIDNVNICCVIHCMFMSCICSIYRTYSFIMFIIYYYMFTYTYFIFIVMFYLYYYLYLFIPIFYIYIYLFITHIYFFVSFFYVRFITHIIYMTDLYITKHII